MTSRPLQQGTGRLCSSEQQRVWFLIFKGGGGVHLLLKMARTLVEGATLLPLWAKLGLQAGDSEEALSDWKTVHV